MKIVQLIKEIGQADPRMAYSYETDSIYGTPDSGYSSYKYSFETEGTDEYLPLRYVVTIEKEIEKDGDRKLADYEVAFAVRTRSGEAKFDTETNKGQLYKVMATVVKILKDRIEKDKAKGQTPKIVRFYPSKTKGEGDERRTKLYAAYAKTQIPSSEIRKTPNGRGVEIVLNNQQ